MRLTAILILLHLLNETQAQQANEQNAAKENYLAELKVIGNTFANDFYPNYAKYYSLPEKSFIARIDSAKKEFDALLNKYKSRLDPGYIREQQLEIKYYFDKLLIDYPLNHDTYLGTVSTTPSSIPKKLETNLADFNKPGLLTNLDFRNYVKAFLHYQINFELKKAVYKNSDNKELNAAWALIPNFISNPICKSFWQYDYLYNHIDNNGIKNIETIYKNFKSTCKDTAYLNKVNSVYTEDSLGRQRHLIKTYKMVGPFTLDIHIFLPDSLMNRSRRPAIVYFHGGSWSEGKPDWFFSTCENYAKKGWVAYAVEYRTSGRHGTLPFEAVMDAKSAIRWIRQHAKEYNLDTSKIVASGNSAGGHLTLCTALAGQWNEKTDDLRFSSIPNVLLVNAGVYDLTDQGTAWIRKDLKDKNLVKEISPVYLSKKDFPPTLIIHGTQDQNVPYSTAEKFVSEMTRTGNSTLEFQSLKSAGHFIWYDPKYSAEVSRLRNEFLAKLGY